MILTDVANVELGFGTTMARPIGRTTPKAMRAEVFPPGSMGPKVEAACRFVEATGKPAMIGSLDEAGDLLRGTRGTIIEPPGPSAPCSAPPSGGGSRYGGKGRAPITWTDKKFRYGSLIGSWRLSGRGHGPQHTHHLGVVVGAETERIGK